MKAILKIGVGATFVLSLIGCQLMGPPSDEQLISDMLMSFEESLMAKDIDLIMSHYSETYSDLQGINKQALKQILGGIKDSGGLDNLEISSDDAEVTMKDDGMAIVGPLKIKAGQFNVTQTYTLVKEEGSWLFSNVETVQN